MNQKNTRFYVDENYHGLIVFIIKNGYPFPLISQGLQRVIGKSIYIELDAQSAYNQIWVWLIDGKNFFI